VFTLGIGSTVGVVGDIIKVICDEFPKFERTKVTGAVCFIGMLLGIMYLTPVIKNVFLYVLKF
jgi:hypothetical protein